MAPRTVVQDLVAGEVSTEVYSVRWNNDDTLLAAGHGDGTVRIYSAADGRFLRRLNCRISPE
jgi:WD40 repeat protein